MKMFVSVFEDRVLLAARVTGPGGIVGDVLQEVRPGGSYQGWSFEELRLLVNGQHEIGQKEDE